MFTSTLIAVNDRHDVACLPAGAALVAPRSRVQVMHVVRDPRDEVAGRDVVIEAVRQARGLGLQADGYVRPADGEPVSRMLAREVRDRSIELLVIGSRGLSSLGSLMRGGVSHELVAGVRATALVVPNEARMPRRELRKVLVAIGGGEDAGAVVATLLRLQGPHGIALAHVRSSGDDVYPEAEWPSSSPLERVRQQLHDRGRHAFTRILGGNVVEALTHFALGWDPDLIVVASRRPTDLVGMLRGSTLHGLLQRGVWPVLIAPR